MISSTFYTVLGLTSGGDVRSVKDKVSAVPGIGAVAIELVPDGASTMVLKHKPDTVPDRFAIEAAVQEAGPYTLS